MKSILKIAIVVTFVLFITSCKEKQEVVPIKDKIVDLVNDDFSDAMHEVKNTLDGIVQSIKDKNVDKLISYHAYSPKFTEFKNGEARVGSAGNESFERNLFGSITDIVKFDMEDLKIAVYGDVANATFHSNFQLKFGEDLAIVKDQVTLLFVNTSDGWKMVHEHHSPLKQAEEK